MVHEIKNLRLQCDGLAQLVKGLYKGPIMVINTANLPNDISLEDFQKELSKGVMTFTNDYTPQIIKQESKELEKAYDSLILAKAWLSVILKEIQPTVNALETISDSLINEFELIKINDDIHNGIPHLLEHGNWNTDHNHIQKIEIIKQYIKTYFEKVGNLKITLRDQNNLNEVKSFFIKKNAVTNIINHLTEAEFWLNFELQRVRENESK